MVEMERDKKWIKKKENAGQINKQKKKYNFLQGKFVNPICKALNLSVLAKRFIRTFISNYQINAGWWCRKDVPIRKMGWWWMEFKVYTKG